MKIPVGNLAFEASFFEYENGESFLAAARKEPFQLIA